jgi:hypothetical protein
MKSILTMLLVLLIPGSMLFSLDVNIIMKDGSVLQGKLLGETSNEIYLMDTNGKTKVMNSSNIQNVFNASNGEAVSFTPKPDIPQTVAMNQTNSQALTNVLTNGKSSIVVVQEPGTGVYYGNYNGAIVYLYGGFWWRFSGGYWYRALGYDGPWVVMDAVVVPNPIICYSPVWFFHPHFRFGFRHRW